MQYYKFIVNRCQILKCIYKSSNSCTNRDKMETPVQISNELEKRISDAFCIFDHLGDKTIDVREVGTVLRFLGCVPTEQEINEIITATETEDSRGEVHLSKFLPHISQLLAEHRMEPAEPEELLEAFHVLDPENRGTLTKEYFGKLMMEEGEPFTQDEVDEMMAVAVDPITGLIPYEYYLNQLMHRPSNSIYDIADKIVAEAQAKAPAARRQTLRNIV